MNITKRTDYITAQIEAIQDVVFDRMGFRSRPFGWQYIDAVNDIIKEMGERDILPHISHDVIEQLTQDNYHTAANAARLAQVAYF